MSDIDKIMDFILDIVTEARVDFPAGHDAGPRIDYDDAEIRAHIQAAFDRAEANTAAAVEAMREKCAAHIRQERDNLIDDPVADKAGFDYMTDLAAEVAALPTPSPMTAAQANTAAAVENAEQAILNMPPRCCPPFGNPQD